LSEGAVFAVSGKKQAFIFLINVNFLDNFRVVSKNFLLVCISFNTGNGSLIGNFRVICKYFSTHPRPSEQGNGRVLGNFRVLRKYFFAAAARRFLVTLARPGALLEASSIHR
jgi:hypothetical protein